MAFRDVPIRLCLFYRDRGRVNLRAHRDYTYNALLRREHRKSNGIDIESWQDVTVANCAVYCGDAPPMEVRCNWSLQSQLEEDTTNVSD